MYSTTVSNNVRFLKLSVPLEFGISEGIWGTTFLTFTSWLSAAAAAWMSTTDDVSRWPTDRSGRRLVESGRENMCLCLGAMAR